MTQLALTTREQVQADTILASTQAATTGDLGQAIRAAKPPAASSPAKTNRPAAKPQASSPAKTNRPAAKPQASSPAKTNRPAAKPQASSLTRDLVFIVVFIALVLTAAVIAVTIIG
jgi:hypothetical protein